MNKLGAGMAGIRCSTVPVWLLEAHSWLVYYIRGLAGPRTTLGPAKAKRRPNKKPIKRGLYAAVPCYLFQEYKQTLLQKGWLLLTALHCQHAQVPTRRTAVTRTTLTGLRTARTAPARARTAQRARTRVPTGTKKVPASCLPMVHRLSGAHACVLQDH